MMDYEQTKFTIIDKVAYCDFCGNICKEQKEIYYRDVYNYYTCNCEESWEYVGLNKELLYINGRLKEIDRQHKHADVVSRLIESEIEQVKRKYK